MTVTVIVAGDEMRGNPEVCGGGDGAAPVREVWVVRLSPRMFVLVFGFWIRGTTEGIRGKRQRKWKGKWKDSSSRVDFSWVSVFSQCCCYVYGAGGNIIYCFVY